MPLELTQSRLCAAYRYIMYCTSSNSDIIAERSVNSAGGLQPFSLPIRDARISWGSQNGIQISRICLFYLNKRANSAVIPIESPNGIANELAGSTARLLFPCLLRSWWGIWPDWILHQDRLISASSTPPHTGFLARDSRWNMRADRLGNVSGGASRHHQWK